MATVISLDGGTTLCMCIVHYSLECTVHMYLSAWPRTGTRYGYCLYTPRQPETNLWYLYLYKSTGLWLLPLAERSVLYCTVLRSERNKTKALKTIIHMFSRLYHMVPGHLEWAAIKWFNLSCSKNSLVLFNILGSHENYLWPHLTKNYTNSKHIEEWNLRSTLKQALRTRSCVLRIFSYS